MPRNSMRKALWAVAGSLALLACAWAVGYFGFGLNMPYPVFRTVMRDTNFYVGGSDEDIVQALVYNQLLGDVGGLCDQGITCEGRQIIKSGTAVRALKEITLRNSSLNATFVKVRVQNVDGWIAATALQP